MKRVPPTPRRSRPVRANRREPGRDISDLPSHSLAESCVALKLTLAERVNERFPIVGLLEVITVCVRERAIVL